jgi:hypothetical protein
MPQSPKPGNLPGPCVQSLWVPSTSVTQRNNRGYSSLIVFTSKLNQLLHGSQCQVCRVKVVKVLNQMTLISSNNLDIPIGKHPYHQNSRRSRDTELLTATSHLYLKRLIVQGQICHQILILMTLLHSSNSSLQMSFSSTFRNT